MPISLKCSACDARACAKGGEFPQQCPSVCESEAVGYAAADAANDAENEMIMRAAGTATRGDDGAANDRVRSIIKFCKSMEYRTIGVAFCVAMSKEARALCDMLAEQGFNVAPVCCKVGGDPAAGRGVPCNPVGQAYVLNSQQTDINVIVGLCLGHDMLFTKYSQSSVTTLVVKDRVTNHNPVQSLREIAAGV